MIFSTARVALQARSLYSCSSKIWTSKGWTLCYLHKTFGPSLTGALSSGPLVIFHLYSRMHSPIISCPSANILPVVGVPSIAFSCRMLVCRRMMPVSSVFNKNDGKRATTCVSTPRETSSSTSVNPLTFSHRNDPLRISRCFAYFCPPYPKSIVSFCHPRCTKELIKIVAVTTDQLLPYLEVREPRGHLLHGCSFC